METVKLGDVCEIQSGGTPSRANSDFWANGTIPWVKISDFDGKYLRKTPMAKKYIASITKKAVNQASITTSDLKKMFVPSPPLELQNQFAAFVKQTDKSKAEIQKSLEQLETLKKSLMQKYFG